MHTVPVNNILWPNKCVRNNPRALNSMILLYSVVYRCLVLLSRRCSNFWLLLIRHACTVNLSLTTSLKKYFTAAEAHQLKIWVKLRNIVVLFIIIFLIQQRRQVIVVKPQFWKNFKRNVIKWMLWKYYLFRNFVVHPVVFLSKFRWSSLNF